MELWFGGVFGQLVEVAPNGLEPFGAVVLQALDPVLLAACALPHLCKAPQKDAAGALAWVPGVGAPHSEVKHRPVVRDEVSGLAK